MDSETLWERSMTAPDVVDVARDILFDVSDLTAVDFAGSVEPSRIRLARLEWVSEEAELAKAESETL